MQKIKTKEYILKTKQHISFTDAHMRLLKHIDAYGKQQQSEYDDYESEAISQIQDKLLRKKAFMLKGYQKLREKYNVKSSVRSPSGNMPQQKVNMPQSNGAVVATSPSGLQKSVQVKQKKKMIQKSAEKSAKMAKGTQKALQNISKTIPPKAKLYAAGIALSLVIIVGFFIVIFGSTLSSGDGSSFGGLFSMPFDNYGTISITDDYGMRIHPVTGEETFHYGIDFGTPWHCEIKSIAVGEVIYADVYGTYGNTVIIKHEFYTSTLYSLYAHLSEIDVSDRQIVMQGEVIGLEGGSPEADPNPGTSTGHHLHFGMMDSTLTYVNPTSYLPIISEMNQTKP